MMKLLIRFVFFIWGACWSLQTIGQVSDSLILVHHASIDDFAETDIPQLAKQLATPYSSESDQFRSIYLWLIHHIEYDTAALNNKRINQNNKDILQREKAICWGYATLLKALCEEVGIPVNIITGYVKLGLVQPPFLKYPNHAWNAVEIDGKWRLVDATWDSQHLKTPSAFYQKFEADYYLTDPSLFLTNHLPATPIWQLVDCPITIEEFQLPTDTLLQLVRQRSCDVSTPPPTQYAALNYFDQQLQRAIHAYQFNPTKDNQKELAHTQIEYQEHLSEKAERLQLEQKIDSLLTIQLQMIGLCEVAHSLTKLYDSQKENCAYNYFNHAVALSQVELTTDNEQQNLEAMLHYFQLASQQIKTLPQNIFTEQALALSADYIDYLRERLK